MASLEQDQRNSRMRILTEFHGASMVRAHPTSCRGGASIVTSRDEQPPTPDLRPPVFSRNKPENKAQNLIPAGGWGALHRAHSLLPNVWAVFLQKEGWRNR